MPARISPKEISGANGKFLPKPLLFHLRHPNSKTNQPKFWQILSSPKNSFAKTSSALKPHALPEYLEGRTPKEKHPFLFQKKFHPRQIRNARSVFSFGVAGVLASAWGFLGAYASVSLHHARGACDIICFGSMCEFGTIETTVQVESINTELIALEKIGRIRTYIKNKSHTVAFVYFYFLLCPLPRRTDTTLCDWLVGIIYNGKGLGGCITSSVSSRHCYGV